MSILPPDLFERLAVHEAPLSDDPPARRAAVAAILRGEESALEVLLMRRREHPIDPWSGHVSFPGGRHDPEDADLLATALRETHEEVGLALDPERELLCRLTPVPARARGRIVPMDITPFVFRWSGADEPRPGIEAAEVFWLPLAPVAAGALDTDYEYEDDRGPRTLPGVEYEGRVVWGLTLHMIRMLLTAGGAPR